MRPELLAALLPALLATPSLAAPSPAAPSPAAPSHAPAPSHAQAPMAPDAFRARLTKHLRSLPISTDELGARLYVDATINGKPCRFKIDTGSFKSSLWLASLPRLGLRTTGETTENVGIGGVASDGHARFDSLALGDLVRLDAGKILVKDRPDTQGCDGLLGSDILRASGAVIDFRARRIHFSNTPDAPDLEPLAKSGGLHVVKLVKISGLPGVLASVNGAKGKFILDTGAAQPVLDEAFATAAGLRALPTRASARGSGAAVRKLAIACPDSFDLDGHSLRKLPCYVTHLGPDGSRRFDGLLGGNFLADSGAIFDFASARLYFPAPGPDLRDSGHIPGDLPADTPPARLLADHALVFCADLRSYEILPGDADAKQPRIRSRYAITRILKDASSKYRTGDVLDILTPLDSPDAARAHAARHAAVIAARTASGDTRLLVHSPLREEQLANTAR